MTTTPLHLRMFMDAKSRDSEGAMKEAHRIANLLRVTVEVVVAPSAIPRIVVVNPE